MDKMEIKQHRLDALQNNLIEGLSPSKEALDFLISLDEISTDPAERKKIILDDIKNNPSRYA